MKLLPVFFLFISIAAYAQPVTNDLAYQQSFVTAYDYAYIPPIFGRKLYQRNTGMILGLQRGRFTSIELGGEAHWRKISLLKPHIIGATTNLEYNISSNVLGYKAGMWMKRGRINLTYGANLNYFTNFQNGHRFGFGPSVGFRILGLHLVNGLTILTKDKTAPGEKPVEANTLYMSLRYYFPVENKFTWDRKTMQKKKERKREREKRKREREKQKASGENKGFWNIFSNDKKSKQ
ncbi:hypothetical protein [Aridibaculum aurantiacum]|uniref:hypothetical protein n=1 Tax=Aridibaculum aurantiacum TaxID=2810307 RepID=UPI001A959919|nr:hypothetical protein [Aridibaculum aurantiacum]